MADMTSPIYSLLAIGDTFTGKSSFLQAVADGVCPKEAPKTTYGCEVHVVEFEGAWFDFYEVGGNNLESQANCKVLAQEYAGYVLFFDLNNLNSLTYLANIVDMMNKVDDSTKVGKFYKWEKAEPVAIVGTKLDLVNVESEAYFKLKQTLLKLLAQCNLERAFYLESSIKYEPELIKQLAPFLKSVRQSGAPQDLKDDSFEAQEVVYQKMPIVGSGQEQEASGSVFDRFWSLFPLARKTD
eukprot:TRINITY_DN4640_c0_g2_i4.p1 TRINITY_DN4640_c0_g2~~TRINITY_DN4640_c0_g2_i4.p1  ORF type:complete len:240 (-),score=43.65 TRINITY_DN4640_c0_g2_i4:28-747(-)